MFQEQEARTNALRIRARALYDGRHEETTTKDEGKPEHINFFKDLEEGLVAFTGTNKDYEREKKDEKEKYEKQIGYLTYLGQDTVEATGNISWYNKVPNRLPHDDQKKQDVQEKEVNEKSKKLIDPLNSIRRYLGINSSVKASEVKDGSQIKQESFKEKRKRVKKRKNHESNSGSDEECYKHKRKKAKHSHLKVSSVKKKHKKQSLNERSDERPKLDIDQLRAKRLKRENEEKLRAARVLAKLRGESIPEDKPKQMVPNIKQKYSSQFNPQLARQNFDNLKR